MAINCGGPAFQLPPEFLLDEVRPRLLDAVQRLKASVGSG
jgi:DNA-binding IclR family transcriptional regulator